jgi:hypothetical protein
MKPPYTSKDSDRLIWQAAVLAFDAVLSLVCVQSAINRMLKSVDLPPMWSEHEPEPPAAEPAPTPDPKPRRRKRSS